MTLALTTAGESHGPALVAIVTGLPAGLMLDRAAIDAAAAKYLGPDNLAIVVVGDRKLIDSQLGKLNLPITYVDIDTGVSSGE